MLTYRLSAVTGGNTISDFDISSDLHSFGTPTINGSNVFVMATANRCGTGIVKSTTTLSNSEVLIGKVKTKVEAADQSARDY